MNASMPNGSARAPKQTSPPRVSSRIKTAIRKVFNSVGLYRFDYPIDPEPRWGYGRRSQPQLTSLFESRISEYANLLTSFQFLKAEFSAIPLHATSHMQPAWNNVWFSTLDAAALMSFIALRKPRRYIEIGSGMSTKFARTAITSKNLNTELISIDPNPRAEINQICDRIIRQRLETLDPQFFESLSANDILFFDGSHRVFANSDVTTFFFDVLPHIKRGTLVHIHDIFWPDDYPPEWDWRLYSEQYLLGAILLGKSASFQVVLPNYFVSRHPVTAPLIAALGIPTTYPGHGFPGVSFWLEAA